MSDALTDRRGQEDPRKELQSRADPLGFLRQKAAAISAGKPRRDDIPDDPRAAHLHFVEEIAREDAEGLIKGDPKYGYSWKKRGGVGAFMMLARKFDRLDHSLSSDGQGNALLGVWLKLDRMVVKAFDIFAALKADTRSEGVIDDIRDLRRYLLLIEAEARAQGIVHGAHRDNATAEPSAGIAVRARGDG